MSSLPPLPKIRHSHVALLLDISADLFGEDHEHTWKLVKDYMQRSAGFTRFDYDVITPILGAGSPVQVRREFIEETKKTVIRPYVESMGLKPKTAPMMLKGFLQVRYHKDLKAASKGTYAPCFKWAFEYDNATMEYRYYVDKLR